MEQPMLYKFKKNDIIIEENIDDNIDENNIIYYHIIGTMHDLAKKRNIAHGDNTSMGGGIYAAPYDENDPDCYIVSTLLDLNKLKNKLPSKYVYISESLSMMGLEGSISCNKENDYKLITNIDIKDIEFISRKECNKYCPGYLDF